VGTRTAGAGRGLSSRLAHAGRTRRHVFREEWEEPLSATVRQVEASLSVDDQYAITDWYTRSGGPGADLEDPQVQARVYAAAAPIREQLRGMVGDKITLYRGVSAESGPQLQRTPDQGLSSWTQYKNVAESYASNGDWAKIPGYVIEADIPVEDVLFTYPTGGEFTIRGWAGS
jgi:hypothetical protein